MKIAIKEWLKHPRYMLMLVFETILASIDMWIGIECARLIATFFDENSIDSLIRLASLMLISLCTCVLKRWLATGTHRLFTTEFDCITDKLVDAEYNMFIEFSCNRVLSITEQMFNIVASMNTLQTMLETVVSMVLLIIAINRIIPQITIAVIVIYGIGAIILRLIYNYWNKIDNEADKIKLERNLALNGIIDGFKEVRGFSTQQIHRTSIKRMNAETLGLFLKRQHSSMIITAIYHVIYIVSTIVGISYCIKLVNLEAMTPAFAVLIMGYIEKIGHPIEQLLDCFDDLSRQLSRVGEFDKLMSYENTHSNTSGIVKIDKFDSIKFEDVSFAYNDTRGYVLRDFNMTIEKGSHIGICGTSGGGKSTMLNLLMGYYAPGGGKISINDINYDMVDLASMRKHIGILNQDVYIFDDTIWYNVTYAKPDATEDEVIEACKNSNIYDFIMELPEKFQTKVGPRGLELSGGQKQRIALARLFLADPDVILLDEATAALDNESEEVIQESLGKFNNKTIITIAHRLSTIENSDVIYVIDGQKIAEVGTHEELIELNGIYTRLNKKKK